MRPILRGLGGLDDCRKTRHSTEPRFSRCARLTLTFGVVLLSILVQGLSMAPLMKKLGVVKPKEDRELYEARRCELRAAGAAIDALDQMARERTAHFRGLRASVALSTCGLDLGQPSIIEPRGVG